jgi:nucleotide-binding universal stress UspA family protein
MAIKDILLTLTTYPEPTSVSAVDEAVAFAISLGARISAIACEVKIRPLRNALIGALLDIPAAVVVETKKSSENAKNLLVTFQSTAEKHGVFGDSILKKCLASEIAELLVEYARLRDLTIVPISKGDYVEQRYAESIIFGSGRPTLILPRPRKPPGAFALDTVVVAWDFSRPAARAVADALPIIEKTKHVRVVTVTNEKTIDTKRSGTELAKHLHHHEVDAILDTVDAAGGGIGDILQSYAKSHNADLLVMGAYGHSRIRDFVLGGATKWMLSQPPLPIFLSH